MPRLVTVMVLPSGSASIRTEKIDGDDGWKLRELVNGPLGSCSIPNELRSLDFYAFCDDDARVRPDPPPPNRFAAHLGHAVLLGPVVIVKTDYTGATRSLSRRDVAALEMYLAQAPTAEALHGARNEAAWNARHPSGFEIRTLDA